MLGLKGLKATLMGRELCDMLDHNMVVIDVGYEAVASCAKLY